MRMRKAFRTGPPPNVALRDALWLSGLHQQDVALLARVSPAKLSHAIYRRRALHPDERERLAKVLRVAVDELFPPEFEPVPVPICPPPPEREL